MITLANVVDVEYHVSELMAMQNFGKLRVSVSCPNARAAFGADGHTLIGEPGRLHLVGSYLKMTHLRVCVHEKCYSNVWLGLIRSW